MAAHDYIQQCTQAMEAALRGVADGGRDQAASLEVRLLEAINGLRQEVAECKSEIDTLRKRDEEKTNEIYELRSMLSSSNTAVQAPVLTPTPFPSATPPSTPVCPKDGVPPAVGLCEADLNKRLQIQETGEVIVCMRRDSTKFGWKKLKDDQLTAQEAAYRAGKDSTEAPPLPCPPPPAQDNPFGAPAVSASTAPPIPAPQGTSSSLFPTNNTEDPFGPSLFPPVPAQPQDIASLFQVSQPESEPEPEQGLGPRSTSVPGPTSGTDAAPQRSASFTMGGSGWQTSAETGGWST